MRRAALAAIVLVGGLLLLLPRTGPVRSTRGDMRAPAPLDLPAAPGEPQETRPPEADAAAPATSPDAAKSGQVPDGRGSPVGGIRLLAIPPGRQDLWDAEDPRTPPLEDPAVPFTHTAADGAFAFPDLHSRRLYRVGERA